MRTALVAAIIVGGSLVAGTSSAGQSHYLLARAFNNFVDSKAIVPPDLTGRVEATHGLGVAGVNPANFLNRAEASTDSGHLAIASTATRPSGDPSIVSPIDWNLAARFEEQIDPGTATGLAIDFVFTASGSLTSAQPMAVKLSGVIALDGCRYLLSREITPGMSADLVAVGNCSARGMTATGNASGVSIRATELRKGMSLEAQVDAVFSYSGGFEGTLSVNAAADVRVQGVGGVPVFVSPTFGSKAGRTPPITSDAGTSGGTSGSSGTSGTSGTPDDAGAGSSGSSSSGGGDSGGCTTATNGAPPTGSSLASVGLIIGAALLVQRSRRRRR